LDLRTQAHAQCLAAAGSDQPGGVEVEAAVAHYYKTLTDASPASFSLAQDNILMASNMKHETVVYEPWSHKYRTSIYIGNICPRNATILALCWGKCFKNNLSLTMPRKVLPSFEQRNKHKDRSLRTGGK